MLKTILKILRIDINENERLIDLIASYSKLKKISRDYKVKVITDNDNLDKKLFDDLYKIRYEIYCLLDKLLDENDYPEKYETDEYDKHSTHLIILDKKEKIIGTTRVIRNSVLSFPTLKEFHLEKELESLPHEKIAEISRFIIIPEYRKTLLFLDLCKVMYLFNKKMGIRYYLGCGEMWFIKKLKATFGEVKILGEPLFCFNALNYPFLIDTKNLEERLPIQNKILLQYFNSEDKSMKF
ncbi:GNAT family N-acetyltransferase [bacterium]|jgi:predicted GNAT family N-acyltransferase|nr:GNAT family N-acetyltransferase [bacterium]